MNQQEKDELVKSFADVIDEKLTERRSLSESEHKIHHDFVQTLVDKEKRISDRKERVLTQFIGWATIASAIAIVTSLGVWIRTLITKAG